MPDGTVKKDGAQWWVEYTKPDGTTARARASTFDVVPPLVLADGAAVAFEVNGTSAKKIRRVGQPATPAAPPPPRPGPHPSAARSQPSPVATPGPAARADFLNPYNFVPTPPRDLTHPDLGDHPPAGHDRLQPTTFTGVISVRLTTKTPLLIVDPERATDGPAGHKTFGVRKVGGRPYLAPTAVKGMLRAAYEAVTNSRFGVFPGHTDRLGLRTAARDSLRLVPARVDVGGGTMTLYPGTSSIGPDRGPNGPMYAAWLPYYGPARRLRAHLGTHGEEVWAFVTLWDHGRFGFWNVVDLRPMTGPAPTTSPPDARRAWRNARPTGQPGQWVKGFVCVTNQNIDNKHDERVFFSTRPQPLTVPLPAAVRTEYANLIRDYQSIHEAEIRDHVTGPPALVRSVWSRHVTGGVAETRLDPGALCHAAVEPDPGGGLRLRGLFPVMISRGLYPRCPLDHLDPDHRLATRPKSLKSDEPTPLSPADRVFGWVNQDGPGAHRGQLRVGRVTCDPAAANPIKTFDPPGLPLAILGEPKPAQARFYLGDKDGSARGQHGRSKEQAGYDGTKRLRGRKVYPHHKREAETAGYWDWTPETVREYARHPEAPKLRDTQNRSLTEWVKPGTTFTFDLHVTNLRPVELGALAYLLELGPEHFHRLGLGKPLGFGSVTLAVDKVEVRNADGWKQVYAAFDPPAAAVDPLPAAKAAFEAVADPTVLKAFRAAATGFDRPTHYPRRGVNPSPGGEMYEWFVENEKLQIPNALPDLAGDAIPGLPLL